MENQTTLQLLKTCDIEINKGISSVMSIMEAIKNPDFKLMVIEIKDQFKKHADEISIKLSSETNFKKEDHKVSETLAKVMTNTKLFMEKTDKHIASLLFDSCNEYLRELYKAANENTLAEASIKELTISIIQTMIDFRENLIAYL